MNKSLLSLLLLLAAIPAAAEYSSGYYDKMNGKRCEELKAAAKQCVQSHQTLVYSQLPNYWQFSDVYPDLYQGKKRWWDMYSDNIFLINSGQSALSSFSANKMQREHAVPKSWWKYNGSVEYTPAYSDMWNLYPSDGPANQAKLNYAFGVCASTTFDNGVTKVGPAATGYGGGSGYVFEPGDEYKGDFARAIFYMATVYDDLPWVYNYMFQTETYPTLRSWAYQMLLQWARQDPVSQKEVTRNDAVQQSQGNRNPFIDFPELAEYIWGTRTTETFLLSEQGGNITPPITGDPELTAPVSGEALDFGEVAIGQTVSAPLLIQGGNLTGPLSVRVTGSDRGMFTPSTTSITANEINVDNTYLLNILYSPTVDGLHEATLMLYDGGLAVSQNVSVTLVGHAYPIPNLKALVATEATGIGESYYTANWEMPEEPVDYFIVNRVRYYEDGPEVEELIANTNSLLIEDRDAGYTESYTVQSSRLGYTSPVSNSIVVAAGAGMIGVEAAQPLAVGAVQGGFAVILDQPHTGLRVTDMAGRTVYYAPQVCGGETVLLPTGIYVVTTDNSPRPLKILVTE